MATTGALDGNPEDTRRPLPPIPPLDGELVTDRTVVAEAADDFGHIVRRVPRAILRPRSTSDIAAILRTASEHQVGVVARGRGHSTFGQAQVTDGIVIDMRTLCSVHRMEPDRVIAEAGMSWRRLLGETLPHGVTPPVLTDYLGLSIGGTLSVGGIGGTTHRYGAQTDTVEELEVVTADGSVHTCGPGRNEGLFRAVLAGHGQCGIITRATLGLVKAPDRARQFKLSYPSATALIAAQRQALHEGRFDHLGGRMVATAQGWRYLLEGVSYYSAPEDPADGELVAGLGHLPGSEEGKDSSYLDFADRLSAAENYLRQTGDWLVPHPTWNVFLPDSAVEEFMGHLVAELVPDDLGSAGMVMVYPICTARVRAPLLRVPDEPVVFVVELLRYGPGGDDAEARRMVTANRDWYERARMLGGVAYPVGSIPLGKADWRAHFGPVEIQFAAAKRRYDPYRILGPGLGIY